MIEGMLKSWYRTGNYDVIRDFISSILAVISVLVILVGTYMTSSGIKKILKSISLYCMSMIQLVVNTKN